MGRRERQGRCCGVVLIAGQADSMRAGHEAGGWEIRETTGSAASFHDRPIPDPANHQVWIHHVNRPALVLGSTQPAGDVLAGRSQPEQDGSRSPAELCRRRSGGGLVALVPGNDLWIDVIVPRASRLWDDDVGVAGHWLGDIWAEAVRRALEPIDGAAAWPVEVHRGRLRNPSAGRVICFAGLGPGEVTVAGRKVVGLSQRRTRGAARLQTVMTWTWQGPWLAQKLSDQALASAGLDRGAVATLPVGLPSTALDPARRPTSEAVTMAFLAQLPAP